MHYNEPSGYFLGDKVRQHDITPLLLASTSDLGSSCLPFESRFNAYRSNNHTQPGRQKEDWEDLYMYGMFGGMALFTILYMYKPDTTVQTWALAEAVSWAQGYNAQGIQADRRLATL